MILNCDNTWSGGGEEVEKVYLLVFVLEFLLVHYTWRTQPAITYRHHLILLLRCLMGLSRRSRINIQIKSNETTIPSYFCCHHVMLFTRSVVLSSPPWNYALVKISFCAKKFSQNDAFQMTQSKMSNMAQLTKVVNDDSRGIMTFGLILPIFSFLQKELDFSLFSSQ